MSVLSTQRRASSRLVYLCAAPIQLIRYAQVEQNLLCHYLHELESFQSQNGTHILDENSAKLLGLLVEYLRGIYADTTQNLKSLLKNSEITYDIL